jgi:glutathione S-transferase
MRYLDRVLDNRTFVAGDRFTMADITAYAGLLYADVAGIAIAPKLTNLICWRANIAARPSVRSM